MTDIATPDLQNAHEFPIWRQINLGTYKSVKELSNAIKKSDFVVSDWATEILKKTTLAKTRFNIDLVNVAVSDLGFTSGARRDVVYDRAKQLGLELAPAEVGAQLCIQYADQPQGDPLMIAMEAISDSRGIPLVFAIGYRDASRWFFCGGGKPDDYWPSDRRWIFTRKATAL